MVLACGVRTELNNRARGAFLAPWARVRMQGSGTSIHYWLHESFKEDSKAMSVMSWTRQCSAHGWSEEAAASVSAWNQPRARRSNIKNIRQRMRHRDANAKSCRVDPSWGRARKGRAVFESHLDAILPTNRNTSVGGRGKTATRASLPRPSLAR